MPHRVRSQQIDHCQDLSPSSHDLFSQSCTLQRQERGEHSQKTKQNTSLNIDSEMQSNETLQPKFLGKYTSTATATALLVVYLFYLFWPLGCREKKLKNTPLTDVVTD